MPPLPRLNRIMRLLGSKWTITILFRLCSGGKRFGELESSLPGISPRTLSLRLRQLAQAQLLRRISHPVSPPHTEYFLTPKGQSLKKIIQSLHSWSENH